MEDEEENIEKMEEEIEEENKNFSEINNDKSVVTPLRSILRSSKNLEKSISVLRNANFKVTDNHNVSFVGDKTTSGYTKMILHNETKLSLSYKVRCTLPRNYGASPHIGYINPCCDKLIELLYKPSENEQQPENEKQHKILLKLIAVESTDKDPKFIWNDSNDSHAKTSKIKILFLGEGNNKAKKKEEDLTTDIYIRAEMEGSESGETVNDMSCDANFLCQDSQTLNCEDQCDAECQKKRAEEDRVAFEQKMSKMLTLQLILIFLAFLLVLICLILLFFVTKKTGKHFKELDENFHPKKK